MNRMVDSCISEVVTSVNWARNNFSKPLDQRPLSEQKPYDEKDASVKGRWSIESDCRISGKVWIGAIGRDEKDNGSH